MTIDYVPPSEFFYDIDQSEELYSCGCDGDNTLYLTANGHFFILFRIFIIPISIETAQKWVKKNCPEKYDNIFSKLNQQKLD